MPKAHLVFTKYAHSYRVDIKNLEELSVEQIKKLQEFVSLRNGMFDFDTYSFKIQKNLEFYEFAKLVKELEINARCEEAKMTFKDAPRIGFGQYKGMFLSDLPDSYLLWLKTNYHGDQKELILKEIDKRKF
jgi:hypothetical protein